MTARGWAIAIACALTAASAPARADVHRLGVAPTGDELAAALATALAPWDVEIVAVDAAPADLGQAATLARARDVDAVVWVQADESGATLWVYDAADSKVLGTRAVSTPPFDAPTAAALSLSVKTLLRHSLVAPEAERFGVATAPPPPPPPPPRRMQPRLFLVAGGGVRAYDDDGLEVSPRLGLQLAWYPGGGRVGLVAAVEAGADRSVSGADFVGSFRDNAVAVGARVGVDLAPRLTAHAQAGASLRRTGIDGVVVSLEQRATDQRVNPAVGGELGARARVMADLYLELAAGAEVSIRRQRYTVFDSPVLAVPRTAFSSRLALVVPFL